MFLLDTDTIIYILKGNPAAEKNLRRYYNDPIKLCVITLMELYYGAYKSHRVVSNLAKIKTLEHTFEILPLGQEMAEIFGEQKSRLEKTGTPLDDFDLMLGCCALSHNLILVTNNTRHFKKMEGLKMTNWIEE
jgi:predicted nucleic acid-binding protein